MSYKPRTLFRIIEEINQELFLPHIQRPFVWEINQMQRLFDSLMKNYPIQTLLFWRTKDEIKVRKFMNPIAWDIDLSGLYESNRSKQDVEKTFVLDGQQRIQSLYAIFSGSISDSKGEISEAYFDLSSGRESDENELDYRLKFSHTPLLLPWYRVSNLLSRDKNKNSEEIFEYVEEILEADTETIEQLIEFEKSDRKNLINQIRRNISQLCSLLREEKHFWIQELDGVASKYPYSKILDIFVRVNSGGTKLDGTDLMFAAMKEGWAEIEESIEDTKEILNGTNLTFDKSFPLKCLLLVHGKGAVASANLFTGGEGEKLLLDMKYSWDDAEVAFKQLRDFLQQDLKVYADKVIRSYNSFILIFDYFYHNPKVSERDRALIRAYHYKAQLFEWFSKSTSSVINSLHSIVGKKIDTGFPLKEIEEYFEGRGNSVTLDRSHLNQRGLRYILLNLIYVDKMGSSPFDVKYKGNEPHIDHIFPQSPLQTRLGLSGDDVNHLGNFRFLGANDNKRKRAELPEHYFTRLKTSGVDIEKHLLIEEYSGNPEALTFNRETYQDFRDRRFEIIWEIASKIVNPEIRIN